MSDDAEDFWSFALEFYARPGVSAACIELQDRFSRDVNILLYACWIGLSGRGRLASSDFARAEKAVGPWRRAVTEPIRAARRALKDAGDDGIETLYATAKALELEAERIAARRLAKLAPAPVGAADAAADAAANLALYLAGTEAQAAAAPIFAALGHPVFAGGERSP